MKLEVWILFSHVVGKHFGLRYTHSTTFVRDCSYSISTIFDFPFNV